MQEIWKDIKGYEGLYQISNLGRVKSFPRKGANKYEKILKPYKDGGNHYFVVGLHKHSKKYYKQIHRLVAEAFIPNPNNYPIVNHKDEDMTNNNISNLEWCSYEYNSNYGMARIKMTNKKHKKKVYQFDINMNLLNIYNSIQEASLKTKIQPNTIRYSCKNNGLNNNKFYWKYTNN